MRKISLSALMLASVVIANPSGIVISEIMYNPPGEDALLEFVEVHNRGPAIFDISGYTLSGDIEFTFPEGTYLEGHAYVAVAADAANVAATYSITNVFGDFTGRLTNGGGIVRLHERSGSPLCTVQYNDRGKWPSAADGTGHSLVLKSPYADPESYQGWTWSPELGGSPGASNFPEASVNERTLIGPNETWRYIKGTAAPPTDWRSLAFIDKSWLSGQTGIGYGDNDDLTALSGMQNGYLSFFARKTFTVADPSAIEELILKVNYDDGFIAYLNGTEVARACMGNVGQEFAYDAVATASHEAGSYESFAIADPASVLQAGTNVLAVQVHNLSLGSTDVSFIPWLVDRKTTIPQQLTTVPLVINEFRADGPRSFVELRNNSSAAIDLAGCTLRSDTTGTTPFVFPSGASLGARSFLSLEAAELPFALDPGEVRLFLSRPDGRVIDARIAELSEPTTSHARFPDGAGTWVTSLEPTLGEGNILIVEDGLVINEVMYNPPGGDARDEYVELYNRAEHAIDLSGCRFSDGIDFVFPEGTVLAPDEYLVIAADAARISARYGIAADRILGDFQGVLADGGEFLRILDVHGNVMDEVKYWDGGRWPRWPDGFGASLELIDSMQDNAEAPAWAASDESGDSPWVHFSFQKTCAATQRENEFHFLLLEAGECLIDNLQIQVAGQADNLAANGDFETADMSRWRIVGTHLDSFRETGTGVGGSACLHVVACGAGDNRANGLEIDTTAALASGTSYRVQFDARWLRGCNVLHVRSFEYDMMSTFKLTMPSRIGTPGERNSAWLPNLGPIIAGVTQDPVMPQSNQTVRVFAKITDSDGIAGAALYYTTSRPTSFQVTPMYDDGAHVDGEAGDGFWTATIPAMPNLTKVLFYIRATDTHAVPGVFPAGAPARTCLYQVSAVPASRLYVYSLILNDDENDELNNRPIHSNAPVDGTLVFNDSEIYYNAGIRYRGSPWQRPAWPRMYRVEVSEDEPFHGVTGFNLSRYGVRQNERTAYYVHRLMGSPSSFQFYARVHLNGSYYGTFEHIQPINSTWLNLWWPDDAEGKLYKITGRHKFDDGGNFVENVWCSFTNRGSTADDFRWWFIPTNHETRDEHGELMTFCRLMDPNITTTTTFDAQAERFIDIDQWIRVHAVRVVNDDWDTIGIANGQNAYIYYASRAGRWRLLPWDVDHTFGNVDASLFPTPDAGVNRFLGRPQYRRLYNAILAEMIAGPYTVERLSPVLDATALVLGTESGEANPQGIKNYVATRGQRIAAFLPARPAFAITSNSGNDFSSPVDLVSIVGNGSYEIATITCNGLPTSARWTSETAWTISVTLQPGANPLAFVAYNSGGAIAGSDSITITCTKVFPRPTVTSVAPSEGFETGGSQIDVFGTGFLATSTVYFGDAAAATTYVSSTHLAAILPPGTGDVVVKVRNLDGQQGALAAPFRYVPVYTPFVRGDPNADRSIDIADAVAVLTYLFSHKPLACVKAADANDDGSVDIADAIAVLGHLFADKGPLPPPNTCGRDPTDDGLPCDTFAGCVK